MIVLKIIGFVLLILAMMYFLYWLIKEGENVKRQYFDESDIYH